MIVSGESTLIVSPIESAPSKSTMPPARFSNVASVKFAGRLKIISPLPVKWALLPPLTVLKFATLKKCIVAPLATSTSASERNRTGRQIASADCP